MGSCFFVGLSTAITGCLVSVIQQAILGVETNLLLTGFRNYYGMASKMSGDLGLQDPHNFDPYPSEYDRNRRRTTWTGMVQLHMTAGSCKLFSNFQNVPFLTHFI